MNNIKFLTMLLMTLLSTQITAQEVQDDRSNWSYQDYWEATQLNFDVLVFGIGNQSSCTQSEKNFLGCMAMLNKVVALSDPNEKVLVKYDFENPNTFINQDYTHLTSKEFFEVKKSYFLELYNELSKIDALNLLAFDGKSFIEKFKTEVVTEANDQFMAAQLYNEYQIVAVDPHSYIIPTDFMADRSKSTRKRKGIGIRFGLTDTDFGEKYVIRSVVPNSPAEKNGIQVGDIVLSANGKEVPEEVYNQIANTDVVTFIMQREQDEVVIEIVKASFKQENVIGRIVERNEKKYAYIKLGSFGDSTGCQKIKKHGHEMLEQGVEGVILDLRDNGGGLVRQMQCI